MPDLAIHQRFALLSRKRSGKPRAEYLQLEVGAAGAALVDLWHLDRIWYDDEDSTLVVEDDTPTGNHVLDPVLAGLVAAGAVGPVDWLRRRSVPVLDRAFTELARQLPDPTFGVDRRRLVAEPVLVETWRDALREALDTQDLGHPTVGLGVALWGADILSVLLGRHAAAHHMLMAQMSAEHWLGRSIREAIGSYTNIAGTYDMGSIIIGP